MTRSDAAMEYALKACDVYGCDHLHVWLALFLRELALDEIGG